MAYYSVNQGKTYDEEFKQGILWAHTSDKANRQQAHWELMREVRPGDIIFSCAKQALRAISVAQANAVVTQNKPVSATDWNN